MPLVSTVGRALLGWLFVHAGVRVLRKPGMAAALSAPTLAAARAYLPLLPSDDAIVIRANASLHVLAGSLLIAGRSPRLSAIILAGSLVPTTVAGHAYWRLDDPAARRQQKSHFEKNVAILGGLLAAAAASPPPKKPR